MLEKNNALTSAYLMLICVAGIVRNVDPVRKVLYVLTPLPLDTLQRVNTLLKGNLEIPAALLLSVSACFSSS